MTYHSKFITQSDPDRFIQDMREESYTTFYLEPLPNLPGITSKYPLAEIVNEASRLPRRMYIVLDVSFTHPNIHLNELVPQMPENAEILVLRSLQKFDQGGYDLVSGGQLDHYVPVNRAERTGYTVSICNRGFALASQSVAAFTKTPPEILEERIRTHQHNAQWLAGALGVDVVKDSPVVYLPIAQDFNPQDKRDHRIGNFISHIVTHGEALEIISDGVTELLVGHLARSLKALGRQGIYVDAGSSFGFNHTRLSSYGPYLRIAPGQEDPVAVIEMAYALHYQRTDFFAQHRDWMPPECEVRTIALCAKELAFRGYLYDAISFYRSLVHRSDLGPELRQEVRRSLQSICVRSLNKEMVAKAQEFLLEPQAQE